MSDTVYIKMKQDIRVEQAPVVLLDLAEVWCKNREILNQCKKLTIFPKLEQKRQILSVVSVIRAIETRFPGVNVSSEGETDAVLELVEKKKRCSWWEWGKAAAVWVLVFFGAAFAIMTFNEDVSVKEVFHLIELWITGKTMDGLGPIELGYSIGLAIGIVTFYNHLTKKKTTSDPTPLEVEMRTYEKEIYTTMIDDAGRREGNGDEHR